MHRYRGEPTLSGVSETRGWRVTRSPIAVVVASRLQRIARLHRPLTASARHRSANAVSHSSPTLSPPYIQNSPAPANPAGQQSALFLSPSQANQPPSKNQTKTPRRSKPRCQSHPPLNLPFLRALGVLVVNEPPRFDPHRPLTGSARLESAWCLRALVVRPESPPRIAVRAPGLPCYSPAPFRPAQTRTVGPDP
jgi:hypothetical protein